MFFINYFRFTPFIAITFLCSCGTDYSRIPINDEEKKIINIFLTEYLRNNSSLLLIDSTESYNREDEYLEEIIEEKINSDLLSRDFFLKNYHRYQLTHDIIDDVNLENLNFINIKELKNIFDKGNWEQFYTIYPESKGIMSVSRIGIYENTALIIAVRSSGFLDASSDLFIYKKINGKWKLDAVYNIWIS